MTQAPTSGCGCPQTPGRRINDVERHAAWHRLVAEQTGIEGVVNAETLRNARGLVGVDSGGVGPGRHMPGWVRQAAPAGTYTAWLPLFVEAVRALMVGTEFTTADMHDMVPDPPHPNHWGKAQSHVRKLGIAKPVDVQPSELETTKDSLVRRWQRVDPQVVAA